MAYEPYNSLGLDGIVLKAVFIRGVIGKDFDNITNVHRVAKKIACDLFSSKPDPDNVTVLECVRTKVVEGFMVLVTDGSTKPQRRTR